MPDAGTMPRDQLMEALAPARALISLVSVPVDEALLAAAPHLRIVANFGTGYDNVDTAAATRRRVVVTNTPDVLTEATADFAFALLLAAARRLGEGERLVRSGRWDGWAPGLLLGADVAGATLGIVGMGRIGRAMARRAQGFSMRVLYCNGRGDDENQARLDGPRADGTTPGERGARPVSLDELLAESDFVSLHCPLTARTRHIIDRAAMARMKSGAILVNTARGGCVDEDALVDALNQGQLAGAGLDVFAEEPTVHPGLLRCERAVLAPHAGSATVTARRRMAEICARAVRTVLDGRVPETVVNPEVYE